MHGTAPNESKSAIMLGIVLLTGIVGLAGIAMLVAFYWIKHHA